MTYIDTSNFIKGFEELNQIVLDLTGANLLINFSQLNLTQLDSSRQEKSIEMFDFSK